MFQPLFQFHKGTIRTHGEPDTDEAFEYFNSIKVQLEPKGMKFHDKVNDISIP